MEDDIIDLRDGIYTNSETIKELGINVLLKKAEYIEYIRDFLAQECNIKDRIVIALFKLKYYGCLGTNHYIYIDPRHKLKTNIETLCHEIYHLKQIKDKKLSFVKTGNKINLIWHDTLYDLDIDVPYNQYTEFPWEIEAFEFENYYTPKSMKYLSQFIKSNPKGAKNGSWRRTKAPQSLD